MLFPQFGHRNEIQQDHAGLSLTPLDADIQVANGEVKRPQFEVTMMLDEHHLVRRKQKKHDGCLLAQLLLRQPSPVSCMQFAIDTLIAHRRVAVLKSVGQVILEWAMAQQEPQNFKDIAVIVTVTETAMRSHWTQSRAAGKTVSEALDDFVLDEQIGKCEIALVSKWVVLGSKVVGMPAENATSLKIGVFVRVTVKRLPYSPVT
ncbi:hypothetical protein MMC07_002446 [Pseudocyphellaria aurata]|nr:hypothetical protein [Pseudocyphellaria aurata]